MEALQIRKYDGKMECLVLWPTYIGEKGRTLGKTYGIKARCYWEHSWGTHWNLMGILWELGGYTLGTKQKWKKSSPPEAGYILYQAVEAASCKLHWKQRKYIKPLKHHPVSCTVRKNEKNPTPQKLVIFYIKPLKQHLVSGIESRENTSSHWSSTFVSCIVSREFWRNGEPWVKDFTNIPKFPVNLMTVGSTFVLKTVDRFNNSTQVNRRDVAP
jgi:hypothetical protein